MVYVGPSMVNFHMTDFCNFNCKFCWYHSKKNPSSARQKKFIERDVFAKVIADCRAMGTRGVLFSGEGEPLLHPEMAALINCVYGAGLELSVNTNGILIDRLPPLVLGRVTNFNINISETDSGGHSSMQAGEKPSFRKVIENCALITSSRQKCGRPHLSIVFIVNRHNFRHMAEALVLASRVKADSLRFTMASVNKMTKRIAMTRPFLDDLKFEARRLLKARKPPRLKTNIRDFVRFLLQARFFDSCEDVWFNQGYFRTFYFDKHFENDFRCHFGWFFSLIDIRGNVFLCCNHQQMIVGNIFKESFEKIWKGPLAVKARLKMKHDFDITDSFWRECHYCNHDNFFKPFEVLYG